MNKTINQLSGPYLDYWYGKSIKQSTFLQLDHGDQLTCYAHVKNGVNESELFMIHAWPTMIEELIDTHHISLIYGHGYWTVLYFDPQLEHKHTVQTSIVGVTRAETVLRFMIFRAFGDIMFEDPAVMQPDEDILDKILHLANACNSAIDADEFEMQQFPDENSGLDIFSIGPVGSSIEDHFVQVIDQPEYAKFLLTVTPARILDLLHEVRELRKFL